MSDLANTEKCKTFGSLYPSPKALCETIFNGAFKYVPVGDPDYADAYSMWFFNSVNPNYAVTQRLKQKGAFPPGYDSADKCWLGFSENPVPVQEPDTMTECHPFRKDACCTQASVKSSETINAAYGSEYRWDRCGKLTPQCERFFVQEACFYECDPNVGLFRLYSPLNYANNTNPDKNDWQIVNMPVQGDYCDAWYDACRYDKFCSDGGGSFFACAKLHTPQDNYEGVGILTTGQIVGITIGAVLLALLLFFVCFLIFKEVKGKPVFGQIALDESRPIKPEAPGQKNDPANDGVEYIDNKRKSQEFDEIAVA